MDKKEATKIIVTCARLYNNNLNNKNLLFIYGDKNNPSYLETVFYSWNFLHLTGVILTRKDSSAQHFFKMCLENRLKDSDYTFAADGTTELKLSVLPDMMNLQRKVNMLGDFDNLKKFLRTEKVVGNITAYMGFKKDLKTGYYLPNTLIRQDIREVITDKPYRILAIYEKMKSEKTYQKIAYKAKGIDVDKLILASEILCRIEKDQIIS